MSGGHFNYKQYELGYMADEIDRMIRNNGRRKKSSKDWAEIYKNNFEIRDPDGWDRSPEGFENSWMEEITREEFLNRVSYSTCRFLKPVKEEDDGYKFSQETLDEFKKAIELIRIAEVYVQRIDWLVSDDDGEETFHKRLKEDLEKIS